MNQLLDPSRFQTLDISQFPIEASLRERSFHQRFCMECLQPFPAACISPKRTQDRTPPVTEQQVLAFASKLRFEFPITAQQIQVGVSGMRPRKSLNPARTRTDPSKPSEASLHRHLRRRPKRSCNKVPSVSCSRGSHTRAGESFKEFPPRPALGDQPRMRKMASSSRLKHCLDSTGPQVYHRRPTAHTARARAKERRALVMCGSHIV